jgi:hypothetical protein
MAGADNPHDVHANDHFDPLALDQSRAFPIGLDPVADDRTDLAKAVVYLAYGRLIDKHGEPHRFAGIPRERRQRHRDKHLVFSI